LITEINQSIDPAPANYAPRHNDLVCAQFSLVFMPLFSRSHYQSLTQSFGPSLNYFKTDNAWYRGRVKKSNPAAKQAEILYIDYGNTELLHYTRIRPLPPAYKHIEAFSKEAQLSFVSLLDPVSNEYGMEAIERFRDYTERRNSVAVVDLKEKDLMHLSLFDPKNAESAEASINIALVRDGLARVDARSRLREVAPKAALQAAILEAKRSR
jgi:staphylococcal nuclease domain-containing protein 1